MLPCPVCDVLSATRPALCASTRVRMLLGEQLLCGFVSAVFVRRGEPRGVGGTADAGEPGLSASATSSLALVALQGSSKLRHKTPYVAPNTCVASPRPCIVSCHSSTHLTWSQALATWGSPAVEARAVLCGRVSNDVHFASAINTCIFVGGSAACESGLRPKVCLARPHPKHTRSCVLRVALRGQCGAHPRKPLLQSLHVAYKPVLTSRRPEGGCFGSRCPMLPRRVGAGQPHAVLVCRRHWREGCTAT